MISTLYLLPDDRTRENELLGHLRTLPDFQTFSALRLVECITVNSAYPPQTLLPLLCGQGQILTELPLAEDTRVILHAMKPDTDTTHLLRAAGVDASADRQTLLLLRGLDDADFRTARDLLAFPEPASRHKARTLPDDAFFGFIRMTKEEQLALFSSLHLALSADCIAPIAEHYRRACRDPFPDEILLLDEAFRSADGDPAVSAPTAFVTDDSRLHAAYADLMAKRRLVFPSAEAPATFAELSRIASEYLAAQREISPPPSASVVGRNSDADYLFAAHGGKLIGGFADAAGEAALLVSDTPFPLALPSPDDRILFVMAGRDQNDAQFAQALSALCTSPISAKISCRLPVHRGGLIAGLGRLLRNSGLGLSLASPPAGLTMTEFLTPYADGVLLVCAPSGGTVIPRRLRELGLQFVCLATVQSKPVISAEDAPERLSFPAAMLSPRLLVHAEIPAPTQSIRPNGSDPIPTMLSALSSAAEHRSLGIDPRARSIASYPAAITRFAGRCACAVAAFPENDPYGEVRDCILSLLARMAANGISPQSVTLSLKAALPLGDSTAVGRAVAVLLALHTVQIELGILAEPPVLEASDTLQVWIGAYAPDAKAAHHTLQSDLPLWLIAPCADEPHLRGEAALLRFCLHELAVTPSAVIPVGMLTPSAAAARETVKSGLSLELTAPAEVLNGHFPAGFLWAAPALPSLPQGAAAIALGRLLPWNGSAVTHGQTSVTAEQLSAAERGDIPAPLLACAEAAPPLISSRRYARPRVLIPFLDTEPTALAETAAELGAEPLLFPISLLSADAARETLSSLAEALAHAQILLLTGDRIFTEALLSHRRILDAILAFRSRGGLVCAAGEAFAFLLHRGDFSADGKPIRSSARKGVRLFCSVFTASVTPWSNGIPIGSRETFLLPKDPICPDLSPDRAHGMADQGLIIACAEGTPDGRCAVTALSSPDRTLLGLAFPPSRTILGRIISYFF